RLNLASTVHTPSCR
ncbi:export membrane family protein, partial [Vibrio harveyi]